MSGLHIGYARVSTDAQDLSAQRDALAALGVPLDRLYVDHGLTGRHRERPGLREALAACRAGDTLVVTKLDPAGPPRRSSRPACRVACAAHPTFGGGAMNKSELIDRVADGAGLGRGEAAGAVEAALGAIERELAAGGEVSITGFGKFSVAERGARRARHPRTGAPIEIPAGRAPRFSAGAKLKQAVAR